MRSDAQSPPAGAARGADFTTFRLGGPVRRLDDCASPAELREALRAAHAEGARWQVIGGGSNLLIADDGWDGVVVRYRRPELELDGAGDEWIVNGACDLDTLALAAVEEGMDGLLFATGIPGTVGGAVAGNAGAFGRQMSDVVLSADLFHPIRGARRVSAAELGFAYRRSALKETRDAVERVRLRLVPGDRARLRAERERILAWRRRRHPDWRVIPTAGSFFRNIEPTSAAGRRQAAGWFLDQAGARNFRVGGAAVYEKHANIIVRASEDCTAEDVVALSRRMAWAVRERFGLVLRREVQFLGDFQEIDGEAPARN